MVLGLTLKNFYRKPTFYVILVVAVIVVIVFLTRGEEKEFDFIEVERGDLIREVNITGGVKPAEEVDLGFEITGRVSSVLADVGDQVFSGQVLVRLSSGTAAADLAKAEAGLKDQKAKLSGLLRGSRPEEIEIQRTKVKNAESSLAEAKQALLDEIKTSFTKADDAIRNKVDILFSNPRGPNPSLTVKTQSAQPKIDVEFERIVIEGILNNLQNTSLNASLTSDLEIVSLDIQGELSKIRFFLEKMALIVNDLNVDTDLTQTTIDSYKADVFSARTNVDTASSNLSTDREKLQSAKSTLTLEQGELNLVLAGTSPEKVLSQEAAVEEAEANVQRFRAEIAKTIIRAPLSGVVTRQEANVGEIVSANKNIISLITENDLEIEANIPESDVVDLIVGLEAEVRLDAYRDDRILGATIISIDPAETLIEGVPTYRTILELTESSNDIKSGMTADVLIETGRRENVLSIPRRAVIKDEDRTFVRLNVRGVITEREVKTGLLGSNGWIEITEGLKEGEKVIISLN